MVKQPPQHNSVKKVYRRQGCASNWRELGSWITTKDWSEVYQATSCISKFQFFSQELSSAIETFPWKIVKTCVYDKPWITVSKTKIYDQKATSSIYQSREGFAGVSNLAE